jgi:predicted Fe-Mo cluster-binding NifX family protein
MKIAFTAKGESWDSMIDPRFGRTEYIVIYDEENDKLTGYDNTLTTEVAHGAGPKTAQIIFDLNADVIITGNGPGEKAYEVLQNSNVKIFTGAANMTLKEAYDAYKAGKLTDFGGETE